MTRPIYEIAEDIYEAWPKPYFGAVPYLEAMTSIENIDQMYGYDTAESVVLYFLANAQTFKGEKARALKTELKQILKEVKR